MKKGIIIGIIALVLIFVAANSVYTLAEDEFACVFRFSEIVNIKLICFPECCDKFIAEAHLLCFE